MTQIINRSQTLVLIIALVVAAGIAAYKMIRLRNDPGHAITYRCFREKQGWGYDIVINKKIIIHQPIIPGVQGFAGFQTRQQAQAVAQIVIEKIKSNRQPFISHQQLQQLGIISAQ